MVFLFRLLGSRSRVGADGGGVGGGGGNHGEISFYYFMKWVPKTCASIYVCMYVGDDWRKRR